MREVDFEVSLNRARCEPFTVSLIEEKSSFFLFSCEAHDLALFEVGSDGFAGWSAKETEPFLFSFTANDEAARKKVDVL